MSKIALLIAMITTLGPIMYIMTKNLINDYKEYIDGGYTY